MHAKRYPSFDSASDDGSSGSRHNRLPRTDAARLGNKKLPRSDLGSPGKGRLPRSNEPETMSEILERLPRANLVPRISDSPWAVDDASLLSANRDVSRGLPRSRSQPQRLARTESPSPGKRLPRSDGISSNLDKTSTPVTSSRKRLTRSNNSQESGDSQPLDASHLLAPSSSARSEARARSLPRHTDSALKPSPSNKLPRTSVDDTYVPLSTPSRTGRLPRSNATVLSDNSMASLPPPTSSSGNRLPRSS